MGGKQMEGDNHERRKKAKEARDEGALPSDDHVTTGASKQRHHLPRDEEHEEKLETRREGKQGGAVQEGMPKGRPRGDVY